MTNERALARMDTSALLLSSNFDQMKEKAALLISSGLLPKHISKPEQAIVIWLQANELGVPPMLALKEMAVINGKPTCSANLMMGLVHQAYGPSSLIYRADTSNGTVAHVEVHLPDSKEVINYSFTIEEAQQAQLTGKGGPWKQYPAAMLAARAISKAARTSFPAVVGGLYVAEELGGEVYEDDLTIAPSPEPAPRSVEPRKPEAIAPPTDPEGFDPPEDAIEGEYTEVEEEQPAPKPKAQKSGDASDPTQYLAEVIEEAGVVDVLEHILSDRYGPEATDLDALTTDQSRNLFRYLRLITQLKQASSYQALTALHERYSVKDNIWDDFAQTTHDDRLAELTPELQGVVTA